MYQNLGTDEIRKFELIMQNADTQANSTQQKEEREVKIIEIIK